MNNISGIYGIRSISHPERVYIGSAVNIRKRWKDHRKTLRKGVHCNSKLQYHCNKYGIGDLVFEAILCCEKEGLTKMEQVFIDLYEPWFNICRVARSTLGFRHSEETKQRDREAHLGKCPSEETRRRMREAHKNRAPVSEDVREKISRAGMGWCPSDETREKMKKPKSEEARRKMREAWKGRGPVSEETRRKMSRSRRGRRHSEETKKKMREAQVGAKNHRYGTHPSEDTRRKLREACARRRSAKEVVEK